jgi:glycosyltransferase involved in cell wall biosynthesis
MRLKFLSITNAAALADAVERALPDEELREGLRRAGRERAAAFRWHACAGAHATIYREVIA